jgi:hypothetical protein
MLSTTLLRAVVSFSVVIVSLASVLPQRDVADKQSFDARDDIPSVDARACRYGCGPHTTTPDGSCGPTSAGYYACRAGYCCSEWGWWLVQIRPRTYRTRSKLICWAMIAVLPRPTAEPDASRSLEPAALLRRIPRSPCRSAQTVVVDPAVPETTLVLQAIAAHLGDIGEFF